MITAPTLLLSLTALPSIGAVVVGHPTLGLIGQPSDLNLHFAEVSIAKVLLTDASGQVHSHALNTTLDLLGGAPLQMPAGTWFEATIVLDGPIRVSGGGNGGTFDLELDVGAIFIEMEPAMVVDGNSSTTLFFGHEDWITADLLRMRPGYHVTVDTTHPLHDDIRSSIRYGSSWF